MKRFLINHKHEYEETLYRFYFTNLPENEKNASYRKDSGVSSINEA